jgi:phospholipid/cholesterol/gamma-HCH transport system ATP-binding protein
MNHDCIIELNGVWTTFGKITIHKDISLCVHSGEVLALVGESGSGKTALLRLMLGLNQPSRGSVSVFGRPLADFQQPELDLGRRRSGVLFQQGALFSALSVFDNVALPLRELKTLPKDVIRELVMMKLKLVEIDADSASKNPAELSGGMVKRVALARALVLDPELLFLDEPTSGLDPERSHGFVQLIESLRQELHLTVVMVTHDVDTLLALADRIAVLAEQRLVALGLPWEVVDNPHPSVQNFFLGHRHRCTEESIRDFREKLAQTRQVA